MCELIGEGCARPFSCCAFITVLLAVAGLAMGIVSFIPENPSVECGEDIALPFVAISLVLCVAHILFVIYLFRAINNPKEGQGDQAGGGLVFGNSSVFRHAWHLFLNDVPMAIYILVFVFSFVWAILGEGWMRGCPAGSNERQFGLILADLLLTFAIVASCLFFGTLFALCCCGDYYSNREKQRTTRQHEKQNRPAADQEYYDVEANQRGQQQYSQQQPAAAQQQAVVYHQPVVQQPMQAPPPAYQEPAPVPVQGTVGAPQRTDNGNQRTVADQALAAASTGGKIAVAAGRGAFSAAKGAWKSRKK